MLAFLRAGSPIFLGGREHEPHKIGRGGEQTCVHSHAKRGAFEKTGRCVTSGGKPTQNLARETCGYFVGPDLCRDVIRQAEFQQGSR